mmetsp:Transcript_13544/g.26687  ORF Transcript_13544/g.26687 Transcript_13544/m.26687 type:complete len:431 (-) Transcript_13544:384-1676(-)
MAEILDGSGGLSENAPLTHGQTLQVARHLQEQIRALQQRVDNVGRDLGDTRQSVGELQRTTGSADSALSKMQEIMTGADATVNSHSHELGRAMTGVGQLKTDFNNADSKITQLLDSEKMNETRLMKIETDLNDHANWQRTLSDRLEKRIERDLFALRDDLGKANLAIGQLQTSEDVLKNGLLEQKEQLRLTNQQVDSTNHRINEMHTQIKIADKRLADTTAGMKLTQVNLEDLNTATLRLYEDHESTKVCLNEDRDSLKKAHSHVKQVHSRVHTIGLDLQTTRDKLDMHANLVDNLRQSLQVALSRLQMVTEGNDRANSTISDLKHQIDEVGAAADAVREGLKESNDLLLPNIHLASPTARRASFRHGSLMMTSTLKSSLGVQNSSIEQRNGVESAREASRQGGEVRQQSNRPTTAPLSAAGPISPQGPA